jgi:hypothetical protein
MASELDKRVEARPAGSDADHGHRLHGTDAHTTRLQELESTALDRTGVYRKYEQLDRRGDFRPVIDLKLEGLPASANKEDLKHIAGARHVIDATTSDDTITNQCLGKGEIKVRLGEGETKEQIIQRFRNQGITVREPDACSRKKNNYKELADVNWKDSRLQVQEKRHTNTEEIDPKAAKIRMLGSNVNIGTNDELSRRAKDYEQQLLTAKRDLKEKQRHAEDMSIGLSKWDRMSAGIASRPQTAGGNPSYMNATATSTIRRTRVLEDRL